MFGKMMNSYYYGKSGKGDYRKEDLPKNRWQLFWEMLRVRFSGLMRLNLLYVLVWLPAILVTMITVLAVLSGGTAEDGTAAAMSTETAAGLLFNWLVLLIPCVTITGPFTAGVSYVTRNWARDEHAFIWSDFKDALKANWKQALLVSFITSLMPVILYVCWTFYSQMASSSSPLFVVPQVLAVMLVVIWYISTLYMYPLMVTYKLRLRDLLRNAVLLAVGRLPQSVGLRLVSLVPLAIAFAVAMLGPTQWALLGLFLYYVLIGYSLSRFVYASYSNAVFDKYINSRIDGAPVNRGLREEEDDEEEDDEE